MKWLRDIPAVGKRLFRTEQQELPQLAKRRAAMADECLLRLRHFSQRPIVGRVEEDRVVAESTVALWFPRDPAFDGPPRFEQDALASRERHRAHEARRGVEGVGYGIRPRRRR